MDTFGSVDPYALLFLEGVEYRTKTIKGSYTPEWNESFTYDMMELQKGFRSNFVVQINDWDATNKDDEVGNFSVPAGRMSEIVQGKIGWEGEETFKLHRDGRAVVGHDKQPSEVTVKIGLLEIPKAFQTLEIEEGAKGPRKLLATLVSAKHLPKVRLGSASRHIRICRNVREWASANFLPLWCLPQASAKDDCCSKIIVVCRCADRQAEIVDSDTIDSNGSLPHMHASAQHKQTCRHARENTSL
jgi:hypothetical protein